MVAVCVCGRDIDSGWGESYLEQVSVLRSNRESKLLPNRGMLRGWSYGTSHNTCFNLSFRVDVLNILPSVTKASTYHLWKGAFIYALRAKLKPDLNLQ